MEAWLRSVERDRGVYDIECDVCGTMIPPGEECPECGWDVNDLHPDDAFDRYRDGD